MSWVFEKSKWTGINHRLHTQQILNKLQIFYGLDKDMFFRYVNLNKLNRNYASLEHPTSYSELWINQPCFIHNLAPENLCHIALCFLIWISHVLTFGIVFCLQLLTKHQIKLFLLLWLVLFGYNPHLPEEVTSSSNFKKWLSGPNQSRFPCAAWARGRDSANCICDEVTYAF